MSADRTGEPSDQPHRARVMAVVFPLLLAAHLVVAGVCRFNLRTSEDVEIALQWGIPVGCALWAYLVVATYRKTGWGDRNQGFGRIFLTSIGTAVASALVICSLHWTVPCEGYEVARYYRALALSASVFVFANAAIVFVLIALLYVLCARLWTSILIGMSITVLLHVIHMVKYIVLQQHLYTWDYMLLGDMFEVLPMMLSTAGAIGAIAGGGVIVVAIGAVAWKESPVDSLRRRAGLLLGGLSTVGVVLLLTTIGATGRGNEPREFFPMWNRLSYNSHYNKSGFYFALLRGTRYLENSRSPEGYSPEAMERIARQYPRTKGEIVPTADVILYMVESLADLSEYGLTYRTDPIPNFHAIARRHAGGRLIVPIYGGNTPNTEFEVLTGLSRVHPWPHDLSYAYRQWITDDTPALPWVFRRWGYRTAVVSGATADFFAEKEAYPRLGFHEFRALGDRAGVATKFDLVSDEAVVDEVISILRSAASEAEAGTTRRRPCFLSITTD
ncbi:MAG: sulfatase-like hydrolase/transferase, partial [Planctomycetes bacterium]|nr:sulfatase-like hydrolase/transferase [Planctomycetota bacterium]